jgi:hypothetical protein
VAWDNDFLYVLAEAYDDQTFSSGADRVGENGCRAAAECEDSLSVMLDGRQDGGYQRIFLGLGGDFSAPEQGQPSPAQVAFIASANAGPRCLLVEARLDWEYVTRTQVGQAVSGKFPPAEGQTYGFDVAVSDVEPSAVDGGDVQTESRVFWVSPGPDYRFRSDGFGTLLLSGGAGQ